MPEFHHDLVCLKVGNNTNNVIYIDHVCSTSDVNKHMQGKVAIYPRYLFLCVFFGDGKTNPSFPGGL